STKKLIWKIASLAPEEGGNVQFKVKITQGQVDPILSNKATIACSGVYVDSNTATTKVMSKWTVMIYIAYKNNLLDSHGKYVLPWLSAVGSTPDVRVVAQVMTPNCTERYFFKEKMENACPLPIEKMGAVETGDPQNLTNFINWTTENYPATHYVLIIADHGWGWREKTDSTRGVAYDDYSSGYPNLTIPNLRNALEKAKIHFDLIVFHACLMQMIEVAYEIKDWTNVVCASEALMYLLPYKDFLTAITKYSPDNAIQFGKLIVDRYLEFYSVSSKDKKEVCLSLVSTTSVPELVQAVNNLGEKLSSSFAAQEGKIRKAIAKTQIFDPKYGPDYRDLFHFADLIDELIDDEEIKKAAQSFFELRKKAVLFEKHTQGFPDATGISIYLPVDNKLDASYTSLRFIQEAPGWLAFLVKLNNKLITKSVDKNFADIGDKITYTITVANTTGNTLANLTVTDTLPTETSYIEGSASGNPSYDPSTRTLIWNINNLSPNQKIAYYFKVKVEKAGVLTFYIANKAHIEGGGISSDSNTVITRFVGLLKATDKAIAKPGEEINYTLTCENGTGETLTNLKITDYLPPHTTLVKGDAHRDFLYRGDTNEIIWTIDSLPPGEKKSITYIAKVSEDAVEGEQLTTKATLSVDGGESLDSNAVTTIVDKTPPNIKISMPQSKNVNLPILTAEVTDLNPLPGGVKFNIDGKDVPVYPDEVNGCYFALPPSFLSEGTHSLLISATDLAGNSSEQSFAFNVSSQPFPQHKIELLSLPLAITTSLRQVLTAIEDACIWNGSSYVSAADSGFSLAPYQGFWVKLGEPLSPLNLQLGGNVNTINDGSKEVIVPLKRGWQAFGLPWTYPLPISGLQVEDKNGNRFSFSDASNLIGLILFRYDGEKYVQVSNIAGMENTLYPWFGYWIMVKDDCSLIFPKEPWNVKAKRASPLDGFCLPIKAVFPDGTSEEVYIGMGKQEITSPFPPPAPYQQMKRRISILRNGEPLFIDIRSGKGKQEWRLAVKEEATLLFPNLSYLPKGSQVILTDGEKRYYLKTTSAVKVEGERELKLEIGEGLITPLIINMLDARATRGGVNISWNVNLECQMKIAIKGADGRLVRDLGIRSAKAGVNSFFWDGKSQDGRELPAGIYIIELTARDELNQMVKAIRMVSLR
ncbi:MAG: clostripain-related cysteine peptidase, partial [bacterium]